MGLKLKISAVIIGLISFGFGAWPIGLLCLLYIALSLRQRRTLSQTPKPSRRIRPSARHILGLIFLCLSAVALAAGGVLSPFVFFLAGVSLLMWPNLQRLLPLAEVVPIEGSILLRSRYVPLSWCAIAELKPGAEDFARAASSFGGRLLMFTDTGKVYSIASCYSLDRKQAEFEALDAFRRATPRGWAGAFLLPLDSAQAAEVLRVKLSRAKFPVDRLEDSASRVAGAMMLESNRGLVRGAMVFDIAGVSEAPSVPPKPPQIDNPPLTWEVFESVGKRTSWPPPDPFSNLLDSMLANKGVPLGERVRELETSGEQVKIQSLSGVEIHTTRVQWRALVSIYS
jgi:hypothetical protein